MVENHGGLLVAENIVIASSKFENLFNFADAELYCSLLMIDGYGDWRIPTKEEFFIISKTFDGIDAPKGYEFQLKTYWTSTTYDYAINAETNWIQNMNSHSQTSLNLKYKCLIRPVRLC